VSMYDVQFSSVSNYFLRGVLNLCIACVQKNYVAQSLNYRYDDALIAVGLLDAS
jgi:hypothetical protein